MSKAAEIVSQAVCERGSRDCELGCRDQMSVSETKIDRR